jgi:hypothetical protein
MLSGASDAVEKPEALTWVFVYILAALTEFSSIYKLHIMHTRFFPESL